MKKSSIGLALLTSVSLFGCGGGDEGGSLTPSPTSPVSMQTIEATFRLGVLSSDIIALYERPKMAYFTGFLAGLSRETAGSLNPTKINCSGGGSVTIGISKSGSYLGMRANDSVSFSYSDCKITSTGTTIYNGKAIVTAAASITNLDTTLNTISNLQFKVASTDLSITEAGFRVLHNGSMNATLNASSTTVGLDSSVPTGLQHSWDAYSPATSTQPGLSLTARSGTRVISNRTSTGAFTLFAKGVIGTKSPTISFDMNVDTVNAITGTIGTNGALRPSSGLMYVINTTNNIATLGSFSSNSLTISGDSDGNGSFDTSFNVIY